MNGWFEGKLARFDFSGYLNLKSYGPAITPETVALPLDGTTDYEVRPEEARVANADMRFYSTMVKADGLIHATMSDLKVNFKSSNLRDLAFIYPDANGIGSFNGSVLGQIAKPVLAGEFILEDHAYKQWKIQQAAGSVRLDMQTESAALKNVHLLQGESQVVINGVTALSGSPVDLRIQSNRVTAQDLRPFIQRDIGGVFAGDARITSISPNLKLEGDVTAENLSLENHLIGNARGHVRYSEPMVDVQQLSIRQNGSMLTGSVSLNRATEALRFTARVNSIDLRTFYGLGLPESVQGIIRQADLQGEGTISRPNIRGNATLQDLSMNGETFPQSRVELSSMGAELDLELDAGRNLNLKGQIDTEEKGFPFTARANFTQYPFEHIARLAEGTVAATGTANLSGLLQI